MVYKKLLMILLIICVLLVGLFLFKDTIIGGKDEISEEPDTDAITQPEEGIEEQETAIEPDEAEQLEEGIEEQGEEPASENEAVEEQETAIEPDEAQQLDPDAIKVINGLTATINQGCDYKLPETLDVTYGDDTTKAVPVVWEKSLIDTSELGSEGVKGKLQAYDEDVTLNIEIIDYVMEGPIWDYNKKESEHFTAYYTDNEVSIIDEVLNELEENYERITSDLKVDNMPKVDITIYPNLREYHNTIKNYPRGEIPVWSVGQSVSVSWIKFVSPINPGPAGHTYEEMMKVIVHEFTHSVTRVKNPNMVKTVWLSEGIALYEAGQSRNLNNLTYIRKRECPTLEEINSYENTYEYDLGYILVEYIVDRWGMEGVMDLITQNGDIEKTFDITVQAFEKGFYTYIEDEYF